MPGTVIQVTDGGRGFVIEAGTERYVVTAAHCLPELPEAFGAGGGYSWERTYENLLGPLGASPNITAECVFVDPITDLAVFGEPQDQELFDQACAFQELTDGAEPFPLSVLPSGPSNNDLVQSTREGIMLSLNGEWFACSVHSTGRFLWIEDSAQPIRGGMSGSPILLPDGSAVGVVCVAEERKGIRAGPNPMLSASLPTWLVT